MNSVSWCVSLAPVAFACTVNPNRPPWVGVPEMTPFGASVRPAGRVPLARLQEFTGAPEAASGGDVYAWLTFASGRLAVLIVSFGAPGFTLMTNRSSDGVFPGQNDVLWYSTVR